MMTGVTIINVIDKPFSLDACIGLCAIFIGCAICEYALNETEPKKTLSPTASVAFSLIRPTLDSGRKKAANRQNKTTSSEQQTKNKTKTKQEQTAKENEREKERENECSLSLPAPPLDPLDELSSALRDAVADWVQKGDWATSLQWLGACLLYTALTMRNVG